MTERVSSDHPTVRTIRATLASSPSGSHVDIPPEDTDSVPVDTVVRIVLDGDEHFAQVDLPLGGEGRRIHGVYETPDRARERSADGDLLPGWIEDHDVRTGGSVLFDVIEPDFLYGMRAPGETAVYEARSPPSDSLRSIAEDLEK